MQTQWDEIYAQRTNRITSSAIRELLKITEQPDFISFAGGMPAPEVFPVAEVGKAAERILRERGAQALQYGATEGYRPLREWIARHMTSQGVPTSIENVLITTGSQQAIDLIGKVLLDEGDVVVVELPTYLAALQAWNVYGARYLPVPTDARGMRTGALRPLMTERHKLIYSLPNFQNPTGATLTLARRQRLVETAARLGTPILEDDPYRELRFEGKPLPRLISLESARQEQHDIPYQGNVIYASTFSKVLAPGLRVGSIVAAPSLINKLVQAKQSTDLHTPTLNQMLAYELAQDGFLQRHVGRIVEVYRQRRDVMLSALAEHFPAGTQWTHPEGGMFLWVTLPQGLDAALLLQAAIKEKVAFVPGAPFHPGNGGANTLRLNFSNAAPEAIREGVGRLGSAVAALMASPAMV
ncbi:MAG: PLP-dependent aminotransferase family protein [Ktedonobacterales bacterium]